MFFFTSTSGAFSPTSFALKPRIVPRKPPFFFESAFAAGVAAAAAAAGTASGVSSLSSFELDGAGVDGGCERGEEIEGGARPTGIAGGGERVDAVLVTPALPEVTSETYIGKTRKEKKKNFSEFLKNAKKNMALFRVCF